MLEVRGAPVVLPCSLAPLGSVCSSPADLGLPQHCLRRCAGGIGEHQETRN